MQARVGHTKLSSVHHSSKRRGGRSVRRRLWRSERGSHRDGEAGQGTGQRRRRRGCQEGGELSADRVSFLARGGQRTSFSRTEAVDGEESRREERVRCGSQERVEGAAACVSLLARGGRRSFTEKKTAHCPRYFLLVWSDFARWDWSQTVGRWRDEAEMAGTAQAPR